MKANQLVARMWFLAPVLVLLAGCSGGSTPDESETADAMPAAEEAKPTGVPVVTVETDQGSFQMELLPEIAPETVKSFVELVELGFYRRTSFHRVLRDKMIQGGDPNTRDNDPYNDGKGGSGRRLKAEFSEIPFERGTVAMARRAGEPDSASSQFFITLKRVPEWDGEYTVFGRVTKGIEVVEAISRAPLSKQPRLYDHPAGKILINMIELEYRPEATE